MSGYLDAVRRGTVVFDGATGTWLQTQELAAEDFGGPDLEGCNEILNLTRPDVVAALHRAYLDVGAHVVETNTFGCFAGPLSEYGLEDQVYEIAGSAARIAREAADDFEDRFVAGSMGPGTKFPTLGQISYANLRDSYEVEAAGLIDGGVDLLIIETQFDLLGLKAAVNGARRAMRSSSDPTSSVSTVQRDPSRCTSPCATCPPTRRHPSASSRTPDSHRWWTGPCTTTSTPQTWLAISGPSSRSSA